LKPLLLSLLLSLPASAGDCEAFVRAKAQAVITRSFPELSGKPLKLQLFRHDSDYFQARPRRTLRVNEKACEAVPPEKALEGVLAHELAHLASFERMGWLELALLGFRYWSAEDGPAVREHERETDLFAAERGYAEGLIAYRAWLYPKLAAEARAKKEALYLPAEELRRWAAERASAAKASRP
jgi:hypothetical protein